MLLPIQTSGTKAPLFFVHGLHGVMPLGPTLTRTLGPDQPVYAINANGIDGTRPVIDNMADMVAAYVEELQETYSTGPVRIGGMCDGSLAAIEIVRALMEQGRAVGPVILADPPGVPRYLQEDDKTDASRPGVARQLYERVRDNLLLYASRPYNEMPFDCSDPKQMELAIRAGVGALVALARHTPRPFSGPVQVIVSARRSSNFFHPEMHWHKLLLGPRMVLVLPWDHVELFRTGRATVGRALKFLLDEAAAFATVSERPKQSTYA
jgi:thioesterase domain-containing protein